MGERVDICWLYRGKLLPADTGTVTMVRAMPMVLATARKVRMQVPCGAHNDNEKTSEIPA